MKSNMQCYHDLLQHVMDNGKDQLNTRTRQVCRAIVGYQLQFDMADGFPAITTKKLAFNNMKGELLGFFRGYTNAADFRKLGCTVWDKNANETAAWLENSYRKGEDDLGPIYGKQWTEWSDKRLSTTDVENAYLSGKGYHILMGGNVATIWERKINQLHNALDALIRDPSDRRIIVSGWNVGELDMMALPPCHMDYRFVAFDTPASDKKTLHVVMTIRSWDLFLGAPFNIASTALFLEIMARLAGMTAGTVTIQATNAHIYQNHFTQVEEQLKREHFQAPTLDLSDAIEPVGRSPLGLVAGCFERIDPNDISLTGYEHHPAISGDMAA
jgi:thymidylate synthase